MQIITIEPGFPLVANPIDASKAGPKHVYPSGTKSSNFYIIFLEEYLI